ncbi:putative nucleotidyltransferase [Lewinella aquimaris]|uniref:Putative nucleotidyltransferase n=1 Tax=Neolewinella aquimaris TaxID=1835722 RepID=A0A840E2N3_9BACT|nr:hypothetical protein [Neolewinella aquimaris]MBB4077992.1 putative nucleotidyltransferase [Neolewinella aquimaris]
MDQIVEKTVRLFSKNEYVKINSIILVGSKLEDSKSDFWSDTDLIVVLKRGEAIEKEQIEKVVLGIGEIVGKEEYRTKDNIIQRLVVSFNNLIEKIDLKIITYEGWINTESQTTTQSKLLYGKSIPKSIKRNETLSKGGRNGENLERINRIWFVLFECIKKFMRNDNLIGLHLLLQLLSEYLVLRMQERDVKYTTNIHRMGYNEKLPKCLEFEQLNYRDKWAILSYIESLSIELDKQLGNQYSGYESRIKIFKEYLIKARKTLDNRT